MNLPRATGLKVGFSACFVESHFPLEFVLKKSRHETHEPVESHSLHPEFFLKHETHSPESNIKPVSVSQDVHTVSDEQVLHEFGQCKHSIPDK